jgi:hypothetical protein
MDGARKALDAAGPDIVPPLTGEVETAKVRGETVYRAVVVNFASAGDAESFCATLKAKNRGCIVWNGAAGSGSRGAAPRATVTPRAP